MPMFTDYAENKIADALFRGQALAAPATWYVALMTTVDNDAGSARVEVSGGSYARVPVAAALASFNGTHGNATGVSSGNTGTVTNAGAIAFPAPTAPWGSIVGFELFDAATGGNAWVYAPLGTAKTVNNGDPAPSFAPAALSLQVDS
jgi:hypothetical protein